MLIVQLRKRKHNFDETRFHVLKLIVMVLCILYYVEMKLITDASEGLVYYGIFPDYGG